jgi:hypothetical protein
VAAQIDGYARQTQLPTGVVVGRHGVVRACQRAF